MINVIHPQSSQTDRPTLQHSYSTTRSRNELIRMKRDVQTSLAIPVRVCLNYNHTMLARCMWPRLPTGIYITAVLHEENKLSIRLRHDFLTIEKLSAVLTAITMLATNEMLMGLLLGVQAVAASSAGAPAMSTSTANEYLSKGKNCVCSASCSYQALTQEPLHKD
jgi:hypothetical protein